VVPLYPHNIVTAHGPYLSKMIRPLNKVNPNE
jgi:hypothetical protein